MGFSSRKGRGRGWGGGVLLGLGNGEKIGRNGTEAVERSVRVREVSEGGRGLAVDEQEDYTSSVDIAQRGGVWSWARRRVLQNNIRNHPETSSHYHSSHYCMNVSIYSWVVLKIYYVVQFVCIHWAMIPRTDGTISNCSLWAR